jgi:hypothetical protein
VRTRAGEHVCESVAQSSVILPVRLLSSCCSFRSQKYLTTIQIVQFMIGLGASVFALTMRLLYDLTPRHWGLGWPVSGTWSGSFFGLAVVISYLILFVRLYNEKYTKDAAAARKQGAMTKQKGDAGATTTPAQYSSLYSPLAKSAPASVMSASQALKLSSGMAEDGFVGLRDAWLGHPLITADQQRYAEQEKTVEGSSSANVPTVDITIRKRTFGGASNADAGRL